MSNLSSTTKPKRRWLQFSIRAVLALVTLLCVALSLWIASAERQRRAVIAIDAMGAVILYVDNEEKSESFALGVLRRWLPQDYFDEVEIVEFAETGGTDDGLAYLEDLSGLKGLSVGGSEVTDDGLAHLEGLTALQSLSLNDTQITDEGLAHLEALTTLQRLSLGDTQITDDGLAHLEELTGLRSLWLQNTQVTDAGLAHLKGLTSLQGLTLENTRVTDNGLAELRNALPNCQIMGP